MKRFTVFALLLFSGLANAQVSITSSDMPQAGDTIRYSNVLVFSTVNVDSTGPNYTWDFSNLSRAGQGLYEYKSSSSINFAYGLFFGFSSFGLKVIDTLQLGTIALYDIYDFYSNSSSVFRAEGRGLTYQGLPIPSFYSDEDEIYQFPLQYGDHDSSTFAVSFELSTLLSLTQSGSRVNTVDGWGTVITPYQAFSCIRLKSTIYELDSISSSSLPFPIVFPITKVEYKWMTPGQKMPVMEVKGNMLGGLFVPSSIRYRDIYRGPVTGISDVNSFWDDVSIFPNPSAGNVNVGGLNPGTNYSARLYNLSGALIVEQEMISDAAGSGILFWETVGSGVYLLELRGETSGISKYVSITK